MKEGDTDEARTLDTNKTLSEDQIRKTNSIKSNKGKGWEEEEEERYRNR